MSSSVRYSTVALPTHASSVTSSVATPGSFHGPIGAPSLASAGATLTRGQSSAAIVTVARSTASVACSGALKTTSKVSSGSSAVSPTTATESVAAVCPAGTVTVSEAAT